MIDAYEIGISLALEDGVSDGVAAIGRQLVAADAAIAGTTLRLGRLQAMAREALSAGVPVPVRAPAAARPEVRPAGLAMAEPAETAPVAVAAAPAPAPATGREPAAQAAGPRLQNEAPALRAARAPRAETPARAVAAPATPAGAPAHDALVRRVAAPEQAARPGAEHVPAAPAVAASPVGSEARLSSERRLEAAVTRLEGIGARVAPPSPAPGSRAVPAAGGASPVRLAAFGRALVVQSGMRPAEPARQAATAAGPERATEDREATGAGSARPLPQTVVVRPGSAEPGPARGGRDGAHYPARPAMRQAHAAAPPQEGAAARRLVEPAGGRAEEAGSRSAHAAPWAPARPAERRAMAVPAGASAGGPAAPAASASARSEGPTQGDVYLDGARVGRWLAAHLAREAERAPSGPTGFDPRRSPSWGGATVGW